MNVREVRQDTPAVCDRSGASDHAHFDGALLPYQVTEAVKNHADRESAFGLGNARAAAAPLLEGTYEAIAALLSCDKNEIALMDTERSWRIILDSLQLKRGDAAVVSADLACKLGRAVERTGITLQTMPKDPNGAVDVHALQQMDLDKVKLMAASHVEKARGVVNAVQSIADIARARGIACFLDASQSVGQIPINMQHLKVDFLVASGSAFLRGPRGTGFVYIHKRRLRGLLGQRCPYSHGHGTPGGAPLPRPAATDGKAGAGTAAEPAATAPAAGGGGSPARHMEGADINEGAYIGLGVAAKYATRLGMGPIAARIRKLARFAREALQKVQGLEILQPLNLAPECGFLCFRLPLHDSQAVVQTLATKTSTFLSVAQRQNHEAAIDPARWGEPTSTSCIVASIHYYNTVQEITTLARHLEVLATATTAVAGFDGNRDLDLLEWVHIDDGADTAALHGRVPPSPSQGRPSAMEAQGSSSGVPDCSDQLREAMLAASGDNKGGGGGGGGGDGLFFSGSGSPASSPSPIGDSQDAMGASMYASVYGTDGDDGDDNGTYRHSASLVSSTSSSGHPADDSAQGSENSDGTGTNDSASNAASPHMANSFLNFRAQTRPIPSSTCNRSLLTVDTAGPPPPPLFCLGTPPTLLAIGHPAQAVQGSACFARQGCPSTTIDGAGADGDGNSNGGAECYLNGKCCNDEEIDDVDDSGPDEDASSSRTGAGCSVRGASTAGAGGRALASASHRSLALSASMVPPSPSHINLRALVPTGRAARKGKGKGDAGAAYPRVDSTASVASLDSGLEIPMLSSARARGLGHSSHKPTDLPMMM